MEHANRAKKGTEHLKLLVSMQPPESIDYEASLKHEGDGHVVASRRLELDLSRYPYPETSRNDLACVHCGILQWLDIYVYMESDV